MNINIKNIILDGNSHLNGWTNIDVNSNYELYTSNELKQVKLPKIEINIDKIIKILNKYKKDFGGNFNGCSYRKTVIKRCNI